MRFWPRRIKVVSRQTVRGVPSPDPDFTIAQAMQMIRLLCPYPHIHENSALTIGDDLVLRHNGHRHRFLPADSRFTIQAATDDLLARVAAWVRTLDLAPTGDAGGWELVE